MGKVISFYRERYTDAYKALVVMQMKVEEILLALETERQHNRKLIEENDRLNRLINEKKSQ